MKFPVRFVTYRGLRNTIETDKLNLPTTEGRRTLLSNHMPIMMPLEIGTIETSLDGEVSYWAVTEGICLFENNQATILCNEIISVDDIDLERATASVEKASRRLHDTTGREDDIVRAKIALARAVNLINTKNKSKG